MNRTKARLLALLGLVVIVTTYILTHLYSPPRSITRLDSNILQLIPAAGNKTQSDIRIVYAATGSYGSWNRLSFQGCPVSKCKLQSSGEFKYIEKADVVLFEYQPDIIYPPVPRETRQHQYWVLFTKEAPKTPYNTWQESVNGKFNLTVTHRRDSGIYEPYGRQPNFLVH
ncbi:hypothetical protein EB796_005766 [Bugula neritina]|uniref:Fucosyltransferase N-terminal domain-containing protein n=1 Tax=Bugula neritina TaxID=10212 RepID=A0A7J7KEL9_BUGNE|nr:hypothetical protein EB796_005766 [Bugula neritina]